MRTERWRCNVLFRYWLALAVTPSLLSLPSRADQQNSHSHFGDMGQVGTVHFPTSFSPTVQPQFERAVAMLHSFWYEEAEKAFRSIATADPNCSCLLYTSPSPRD